MAFSFFSDNNLLNFLVFLNTRINNDKTDFTIHSRHREIWENKYGIKFQGSINIYLDFLTKKEILKYILIRPKLSEKNIFIGCNGTIDIDRYRSFFMDIISKSEYEWKRISNKLIETEGEFQQAKEKLVSCKYKLTEAEECIKKAEYERKKAQEEKEEVLGFSPEKNGKQIKKTKEHVQDFLEIAKEDRCLSGYVDQLTELTKNIDSIEIINDNYIHVYNNIIKPMKDETDKSIKEIKSHSNKETDKSIKEIKAQSRIGTIITVGVAIISIVITVII
jgi:hypothetical protein